MTQNTLAALKQPEPKPSDFANFTDEQTDAVIVYLAKLVRETLDKHGATDEQKRAREKQFMAIMDSWPKDFFQRVVDRVINCDSTKNSFWAVPADAMIAATKAVELT